LAALARRWVIPHISRACAEGLRKLKALGLDATTIPACFLWRGGRA